MNDTRASALDKKRILITDRFATEAMVTLSQQPFFTVEKSSQPQLFETDLAGVNGLIIRSRSIIDETLLKRAKQLQVIITATSGFDHIDLNACEKWGVTVMFTPEANVESAAQLTWGLVLSCMNRIAPAHRAMKAGEWNRELLVGQELASKTYGIVGLGRIGQRVAEFAETFKMKVQAYDPYAEERTFHQHGVERVAFEEILKSSDILSFHVPKTRETQHMLNRSHFEYINRGITIINTSRGSVIAESDLTEALEKNWLGAVGLDVYEKEPLPRSSKLLQFSNVILTPHIGANTQEAFAKASEQAALKMIRFFIDGNTSDTLPPKAPWYGAVSAF